MNNQNACGTAFIRLLVSLWLPLPAIPAAQFADLAAEIEINNWSYWFFEDVKGVSAQNVERVDQMPC
jgi:hypothetical protein